MMCLSGLEGCAGMAAIESDASDVCIRPGGVRWHGCNRELYKCCIYQAWRGALA